MEEFHVHLIYVPEKKAMKLTMGSGKQKFEKLIPPAQFARMFEYMELVWTKTTEKQLA